MITSIFRRTKVTALIEAHGPHCHYCKRKVRLRVYGQDRRADDASLDHKIPKSKGGTNDDDNLILSCSECNNAKGDRSYEDFVARPYRLKPPKPPKPVPKVKVAKTKPKAAPQVKGKPGPKAHTLEQLIAFGQYPRQRGDTLPKENTPAPIYVHSQCQPPQKLTGLEVAQYLRAEALKRNQKWPLA